VVCQRSRRPKLTEDADQHSKHVPAPCRYRHLYAAAELLQVASVLLLLPGSGAGRCGRSASGFGRLPRAADKWDTASRRGMLPGVLGGVFCPPRPGVGKCPSRFSS
jgi:hypothetical protein